MVTGHVSTFILVHGINIWFMNTSNVSLHNILHKKYSDIPNIVITQISEDI